MLARAIIIAYGPCTASIARSEKVESSADMAAPEIKYLSECDLRRLLESSRSLSRSHERVVDHHKTACT